MTTLEAHLAAGRGRDSGGACTLVSEEMEEISHSCERCADAGFVAAPHQRVPLLIGSSEDVRLAEEFYAARRA